MLGHVRSILSALNRLLEDCSNSVQASVVREATLLQILQSDPLSRRDALTLPFFSEDTFLEIILASYLF